MSSDTLELENGLEWQWLGGTPSEQLLREGRDER